MNKILNTVIYIATLLLFAVFGFIFGIQVEKSNYIQNPTEKQLLYDSVYTEIVELHFKNPHVIFSEIMYETDSLNSDIFITNHNIYNITPHNTSLPSTMKGVQFGYSYYTSWQESLIDLAIIKSAKQDTISKNKIKK